MISVEEAKSRLLKDVFPIGTENLVLEEALGRILAADQFANRDQPPFPASAMDGYAVRADDLKKVPTELAVVGESAAGQFYDGEVQSGQAVRIFTGAPVPKGADAILIQENAHIVQDRTYIQAKESVSKGLYIRSAALDFSADDKLLQTGKLLCPADLALSAAMNHAHLPVFRRPKIAILATGDELVEPGEIPAWNQIIASNHIGVGAMAQNAGAEVLQLGIANDNLNDLGNAIDTAQQASCDILVTLGGASVGDHDLVQEALRIAGMELDFWRIAMRPGKPLMFGHIPRNTKNLPNMRVLGLPGNPVSSLVCTRIFLVPLIYALLGLDGNTDKIIPAILGADLDENDKRQDYLRASLHQNEKGELIATPFSRQDSSMLATYAKSDALILRKPHAPKALSGSSCAILKQI